jgi:hypothetical protein
LVPKREKGTLLIGLFSYAHQAKEKLYPEK